MARNVEIKARVDDLEVIKRRVLDLKSTMKNDENSHVMPIIMKQEDTFYNLPVSNPGKLKLRKVQV